MQIKDFYTFSKSEKKNISNDISNDIKIVILNNIKIAG